MTTPPKLSFLDAARTVLAAAGAPLHYREITDRALAEGLLSTSGATPWETMNARLAVSIQRQGATSVFTRVKPGVFALRAWGLSPDPEPDLRARVSHLPTWAALGGFLRGVDGKSAEHLTALRTAIRGLRGEGRDFTQPQVWLNDLLEDPARSLGLSLWSASGGVLNPRYVSECTSVANRYDLVEEDDDGLLRVTGRGEKFLAEPGGGVTRELDTAEGVAAVLALVAQYGPARTGELLAPYAEWCTKHSGIRSEATVRVSLGTRLLNLVDRGLVSRSGQAYAVTSTGLSWLGQEAVSVVGDDAPEDKDELVGLLSEISEQQQRVRERIRAAVDAMDGIAFEHLIKRLLDEMGYQQVEVTKASGDKGVDVVGRIQVGITPVTEVIQAKRQKANVGRPVLDALRGSLYRWSAQRGTIITTASFTQGARDAAFDVGTAPIQLIDGERLVGLLVDYGIGLKQQSVKLWRFDAEPFVGSASGAASTTTEADEEDE